MKNVNVHLNKAKKKAKTDNKADIKLIYFSDEKLHPFKKLTKAH